MFSLERTVLASTFRKPVAFPGTAQANAPSAIVARVRSKTGSSVAYLCHLHLWQNGQSDGRSRNVPFSSILTEYY